MLYRILIFCFFTTLAFAGFPLDITVDLNKKDFLVFEPILISVEVKNISEKEFVGPPILKFSDYYNGLLIKVFKDNQFIMDFPAHAGGGKLKPGFCYEHLSPGEMKKGCYVHHYKLDPGTYILTVQYGKDQPLGAKTREKFRGRDVFLFENTSIEFTVHEPAGVDKEVYDTYFKDNSVDNFTPIIKKGFGSDIITKYPQSVYSPWLVCSSPSSKAEYYKGRDAKQHVEVHLKHKNWLRDDDSVQKDMKEKQDIIHTYVQMAESHPDHICSLSFYLTAVDTAITIGEFNTACELINKILKSKPRNDLDAQIQQKAREYQHALKSHDLCI